MSDPLDILAGGLAEAILAGPWTVDELVARMRTVLGPRRGGDAWLARLAERLIARFGAAPPPPRKILVREFMREDPLVLKALGRDGHVRKAFDPLRLPPPVMTPAAPLAGLANIPELTTPGQLADWLELSSGELDWLADRRGQLARRHVPAPLRHYTPLVRDKPRGGKRLIEAPKKRLREIQRRILHEILDHVPAHPAAHAFRAGRSVRSCLAPHSAQHVVLSIDLREFFPSIPYARVAALFRTLGYPERLASVLASLTTTWTPEETLDLLVVAPDSRDRHRVRHLPQGAPTSPALANLCAHRLDTRLDGLARAFDARYTRYADDLIFSGDSRFARALDRFRVAAGAIILDEGFTLHRRKTRVLPNSQRQKVAGLVVNARPGVPREDYDALRALLFNCVRFGPESQNHARHERFRDHLQGRIAWIAATSDSRGRKLRALFDQIDWSPAPSAAPPAFTN